MRRRLPLAATLGAVISAGSVAVLASRIDLAELGRLLGQTDARLIAVALAALAMSMVLRTLRWRAIYPVREHSSRPRLSELMPVVLVGYALNNLIPLRLGEVARAIIAARMLRTGLPEAIGSVGLERVLDAGALAGVAILVSVGLMGPTWLVPTALAIAAVAACLVVAAILISRRSSTSSAREVATASVAVRLWRGFSAHPRAIAMATAVGSAAWLLDGATAWMVAAAIGVSVSWQVAMLIAVGAALGAALPSAPAAIGTFHLGGTAVAVALGMGPAEALAIVTLWHVVTVIPLVVAGGLSAPLIGLGARDLVVVSRRAGLLSPPRSKTVGQART